jgi:hypothetical protein
MSDVTTVTDLELDFDLWKSDRGAEEETHQAEFAGK